MRALLWLFPRRWRNRYGDELVEQLGSDPRRLTKWIDIVRTAAGLRWRAFSERYDSVAAGLVGALALALGCDVALGVGMDEGVDAELLQHWWGTPFAAGLGISAVLATASLVAVLGDRRRRRFMTVLIAGIVAGGVVGSAALAAVSFDLAAVGAGIGLTLAMASARVVLRTPLSRRDGLLVVAVPMILVLGWRSATSPVGPLELVVVAAALVTSLDAAAVPKTVVPE
jgi:hypothetical protein